MNGHVKENRRFRLPFYLEWEDSLLYHDYHPPFGLFGFTQQVIFYATEISWPKGVFIFWIPISFLKNLLLVSSGLAPPGPVAAIWGGRTISQCVLPKNRDDCFERHATGPNR